MATEHRVRTGSVTAFDEARGLGTITLDAGTADDGAELPFHCTALTDGSRTVAVGARVVFAVTPGHLGRYEAADLVVAAAVGVHPEPPAR